MEIDKNFFIWHFKRNWNDRSQPWHWAVGSEDPQQAQLEEESRQWRCIDASFSLPRQLRGELVWTRISYYRFEKMYTKTPSGRRLRAVRAHPLVYVLIDAAWTRNLRYLTNKVKDISFANMEKPHRDALMTMHELREDLDYAKGEIAKAVRYAPPTLADYFERSASSEWYQRDGLPLVFLKEMENDAATLDEFLTNSLNLLLASLALRDSQRADMLTWLAAVYVPLSFVTGIFGMNLRELNDSTLPVWICLEVLGVVLLVTAALVIVYKLWEQYSGVLSRNSKGSREIELY
ncbi:hypothetical protein MBLNU13_g08332t2 [Cladosporium sp. NU13]